MTDPEYADVTGPVRGRGAGLNPANRFEGIRLHVLGDHLDERWQEAPGGAQVATRVTEDHSRTVINEVDSPDIPFRWTVNPYRGCEHGCIYCYARPGHEYLGLSCGLDFETRILAKFDAPVLLRRELAEPGWCGEPVIMCGVTDPYQPVEERLRITRGCLEVMAEFRQPVSLITKNRLITRDIDLLSALARDGRARAAVSITTLDNRLAAKMEPRASSPGARLEAVRQLADAGVPVSVMTAPIIPGVNDREIPDLLRAGADAGARSAGYILLRLPYQVEALFLDWLRRTLPDRARHVESLIRQSRGGRLSDSAFGRRMRGQGPFADQVAQTFKVFAARFGLDAPQPPLQRMPPREPAQPSLFG